MARRITPGLRVPPNVRIRVHPQHIALHGIRRDEAPNVRVIIPGIVVHQLGVVHVLAGEPLAGVHHALLVAQRSVGSVDLIALDGCRTRHRGESGEYTAQCIGQGELSVGAVEGPDQSTTKRVGVRTVGCIARPVVEVLFGPEGVGEHRVAVGRRATQHPLTRSVIDVPLAVGTARIPLDEMVQHVRGEGGGRPTGDAGGLIAPTVVARRVAGRLATSGGTRCSRWIQSGQLMRVHTITEEVLHRVAIAVERADGELSQVGVAITVGVGGSDQAIGKRGGATGAVARSRSRPGITGPD